MKWIKLLIYDCDIILISMGSIFFKSGEETLQGEDPPSFFHFKIKNIEDKLIDFHDYKGKKAILVVNVACK